MCASLCAKGNTATYTKTNWVEGIRKQWLDATVHRVVNLRRTTLRRILRIWGLEMCSGLSCSWSDPVAYFCWMVRREVNEAVSVAEVILHRETSQSHYAQRTIKKLSSAIQQSPFWEANTHLVKKSPAFYGTLSFITMFTTARHWSLSRVRWIKSTLSHSVSLGSIPILLPIYP